MARAWWPAWLGALLFFFLGNLLIPYPGLQEDEAIFAAPVYRPEFSFYQVQIGRKHLQEALRMFEERDALWISHARENDTFIGINEHLETMAATAGYQMGIVATFPDTNGRAVFEAFRLLKGAQPTR